MDDTNGKAPIKVKVQDKRRTSTSEEPPHSAPLEDVQVAELIEPDGLIEETASDEPNYLDDLVRLQAEFDNYRKRMMRESAVLEQRGAIRVIERLLSVLDNFEKAIAHGEGGEGVALVHKQLLEALAQSGLEEIPAADRPFDPSVHEAVDSHEDPDVAEQTVRTVYRNGYKVGGRLLRPAMVSVARPAESIEEEKD